MSAVLRIYWLCLGALHVALAQQDVGPCSTLLMINLKSTRDNYRLTVGSDEAPLKSTTGFQTFCLNSGNSDKGHYVIGVQDGSDRSWSSHFPVGRGCYSVSVDEGRQESDLQMPSLDEGDDSDDDFDFGERFGNSEDGKPLNDSQKGDLSVHVARCG